MIVKNVLEFSIRCDIRYCRIPGFIYKISPDPSARGDREMVGGGTSDILLLTKDENYMSALEWVFQAVRIQIANIYHCKKTNISIMFLFVIHRC